MGRGKRAAATAAVGTPATPQPPAPAAAPPSPLLALAPGLAPSFAAARPTKRRRSKAAKASEVASSAPAAREGTQEEPAVPLSAAVPEAAPAAAEDVCPASFPASTAEEEAEAEAAAEPRPKRRTTRSRRGKAAAVAAEEAQPEEGSAPAEAAEEEAEEEQPKKKRGGRRREPDAPPLKELPSRELIDRLKAEGFAPPPLPVPNLGYACLNMDMRELKPPVFTSRDCVQRTKDQKGLPHLGSLFLANAKDLLLLIQWNHEHGIRLFRMSSVLCPWMGTFDMAQLPQYEEIKGVLRLAGDLARLYDQRLTFHPSHFVKLGTPDKTLADKSIRELEAHSQTMDLLGYPPSPVNKINIHVGGVYKNDGSKEDTMRRWAANFRRLSPSCRARMAVENDDVASAFSLQDLLFLHKEVGVPLTFDFHHHRFCPGDLSEKEALLAAVATWPPGVRPVVHWSESQAGRKPHAHSDYVRGPINLHGLERQVDVMIEAKCKERALLAIRGDIPMPAIEEASTQATEDAAEEEA